VIQVPRTHIDDEYAHAAEREPKVLITTSRDPSSRLVQFAKELKLVFPNSQRINRGGQVSLSHPGWLTSPWSVCPVWSSCMLPGLTFAHSQVSRFCSAMQVLGELVEACRAQDFTDMVMVHEHRGEPDGLVVSHMPYGPTAYFGIFNTVRPRRTCSLAP